MNTQVEEFTDVARGTRNYVATRRIYLWRGSWASSQEFQAMAGVSEASLTNNKTAIEERVGRRLTDTLDSGMRAYLSGPLRHWITEEFRGSDGGVRTLVRPADVGNPRAKTLPRRGV